MSDKPSASTEAKQRTPHDLILEKHVKETLSKDKGSDAELVSWTIKDFTSKGDNYACMVTSVVVNYSLKGEEKKVTYIVKCNPCRNADVMKSFVSNAFQKEAGFYTNLVPLFNAELQALGLKPLRLANCLCVHLEENEELIFLSDLRSEDFKMFDRRKGLDKDHVTLVMNELGRLHAASILVQSKTSKPLEELYDFLNKDFLNISDEKFDFRQIFTGNVLNAAEMTGRISGYEKVTQWLKDLAPRASEIVAEQSKKSPPFDVVCHGDCWNNNMLFRYDEAGIPTDVRLLDLQICRKASPATDLAYLLNTSLNGDVRKANLQSFLKLYHDGFKKVLATANTPAPYSFEELYEEYKAKSYFGLLMGLMVIPIVVSEAADVMDLEDFSLDDMEQAMKEHKERVFKQLDTNPLLRPRLLSMFDDMIEYGIIS